MMMVVDGDEYGVGRSRLLQHCVLLRVDWAVLRAVLLERDDLAPVALGQECVVEHTVLRINGALLHLPDHSARRR